MKTFNSQFITFAVTLNEHAVGAETLKEQYGVYDAAHAAVEKAHWSLPHFLTDAQSDPDGIQAPRYELCANDGIAEETEGVMAWPLSIFSHQRDIPQEALIELRDLVVTSFQAEAAKKGMTARLVAVTRQQSFTVTEDSKMDLLL